MANVTVRNIPEDIFSKIKTLSAMEKRSINNEILIVLESGLAFEVDSINKTIKESIPKELQIRIWEDLSGKWKDNRTTEQIKEDIISSRTLGRDIKL
ncbi:MAG: hypothetical protein KAR21_01800 [Spirochaetales bacterium]|nr:hypothetical protein [Spirochaetales bacterium]